MLEIIGLISLKLIMKSGNLEYQQQRLVVYMQKLGYLIIEVYKAVNSSVNDRTLVLNHLLSHCQLNSPFQPVIIKYSNQLARFGYKYLESYF